MTLKSMNKTKGTHQSCFHFFREYSYLIWAAFPSIVPCNAFHIHRREKPHLFTESRKNIIHDLPPSLGAKGPSLKS